MWIKVDQKFIRSTRSILELLEGTQKFIYRSYQKQSRCLLQKQTKQTLLIVLEVDQMWIKVDQKLIRNSSTSNPHTILNTALDLRGGINILGLYALTCLTTSYLQSLRAICRAHQPHPRFQGNEHPGQINNKVTNGHHKAVAQLEALQPQPILDSERPSRAYEGTIADPASIDRLRHEP